VKSVLLDTHTWVWALQGEAKLSHTARRVVSEAEEVRISPISFYEIAQKVRLGKWDALATLVASLPRLAEQQGVLTADLQPAICLAAGLLDWSNRDPFDRIIAATARHFGLPLVSIDAQFDGLVTRVW
jgi:PIN domain nuclease of toxin-antitoxin system